MRRLRIPAAVAVTIVGAAACSSDDRPPHPDAMAQAHADAHVARTDAAVPDAPPSDAGVPADAPPDTPIT